jgi:hypothetical protein
MSAGFDRHFSKPLALTVLEELVPETIARRRL